MCGVVRIGHGALRAASMGRRDAIGSAHLYTHMRGCRRRRQTLELGRVSLEGGGTAAVVGREWMGAPDARRKKCHPRQGTSTISQPASRPDAISDGWAEQARQAGQQDDGAYQAHASHVADLPARVATSLFPLMQYLMSLLCRVPSGPGEVPTLPHTRTGPFRSR